MAGFKAAIYMLRGRMGDKGEDEERMKREEGGMRIRMKRGLREG